MAYDENIDRRIRKIVSHWPDTDSRKMFGGICHLLHGNMFCGVHKEYLILRLGNEQAQIAMESAHVRPFDMTGKPMKGWIMVASKGFEQEAELEDWLHRARAFTESLPQK